MIQKSASLNYEPSSELLLSVGVGGRTYGVPVGAVANAAANEEFAEKTFTAMITRKTTWSIFRFRLYLGSPAAETLNQGQS